MSSRIPPWHTTSAFLDQNILTEFTIFINILNIGLHYMPVLQERSIVEAKQYCRLGLILIVEAHATWGAGRTIIDQLQRHTPDTRYFHETQVSINILKIGPSQSSIIRNKFIYRKYLL